MLSRMLRNAGLAVLAGLLLGGCVASRDPGSAAPGTRDPRPLLVEGAMPVEVDRIASRLDRARQEQVGGWTFWIGTIDGYPVVVSKTLKGVANAAAATAIAVERFHPAAIINQGTAGGHDSDLHVGDIVVGRYSVSLAAFKTPERARGTGSDTMQWQPLDLNASEGSASQDPDARTIRRFPANDRLLAAAGRVRQHYQRGKVVDGVIGSSDVWNSELDRIQWFHEAFGTSVEEMETAPAAQVAGFYGIPFLGIRVLSNNITNGGAYDPHTAEACQEFVYEVARAYIDAELKPGATARSRP